MAQVRALILLSSLKQDAGELSAKIALPHTSVLGRHEIDFVHNEKHLFALLLGLELKFITTAAFGISGIKYLYNDISCFNNLLQFFVIGASRLSHLSIVRILDFTTFNHKFLSLCNFSSSEPAEFLLFFESFNFGIDLSSIVFKSSCRKSFLGISKLLKLFVLFLVHVHFSLHSVEHLLLERIKVRDSLNLL